METFTHCFVSFYFFCLLPWGRSALGSTATFIPFILKKVCPNMQKPWSEHVFTYTLFALRNEL